ncbi:MAG: ribonuclease Z [Candidatus Thermoplasmatota archaeon]|nr:ribonuclease Z [Candidatus Thermoplasmatota archaeon]
MPSTSQMKIVFLGTGGSYPSPQRNVSALALKAGGEVILFDCGEGTQRQLMSSSISFMAIDKIFITHLHGDHFLGLPGLLQTMNMNDREEKVKVYCPGGTAKVLKKIISSGYFRPPFPVKIYELKAGARVDFDGYSMTALRAAHNVPSLAYSFKENDKKGRFDKQKALDLGVPEGPLFSDLHEGHSVEVDGKTIEPEQVVGPPRKGKKVVYTGDTKPCEEIIEGARNADVLIHEGTLDSSLSDAALSHGHSSVEMAAEVARKAGVSKLFIDHISPRYEDVKELEDQAKEIFENSIIPDDLSEHEI